MTKEEKEKIIAECEHMSFDFELFGRLTKALCLDAVKYILNDISESEYISDDNPETESEIKPTFEHDSKAVKLRIAEIRKHQSDFSDLEPTTKNDLAVDAISRKDTIDWLKSVTKTDGITFETGFKQILYDIEQMPSVTPQPRKGHWIVKNGTEEGYDIGGVKTWYIQIMCNKCGFIKTAIEGHTGQYHFCPNCGSFNGGDNND